MEKFNLSAPCIFGVEGVLADELRRMGALNVTAENGRVDFSGDANIMARANICSRCAERILITVGSFKANTFDSLFEGVKALPWENYIGKTDAFPVKGWSLNSALHSIPDCQKIVKKAIVDRLASKYNVKWFEETGPQYSVRFSILKDEVTLSIDTSGEGLHKRGYRRNSNDAPLKETLAAAMLDIARIYPDTVFYDPFCGSGTLLIEAALKAANIAPGLRRGFTAERFSFIPQKAWQEERMRAGDLIRHNIDFSAYGSDIDDDCVQLTQSNAKKAGVEKYITVKNADFKDFTMLEGRGLLVTNPPYGERLLDIKAAEELYLQMGKLFVKEPGKKYYIISPDDDFEKIFGRPADKRRKLYNGMIKCQLYMYFK